MPWFLSCSSNSLPKEAKKKGSVLAHSPKLQSAVVKKVRHLELGTANYIKPAVRRNDQCS